MRTSLKARLGALVATAALATSGVMAASGVVLPATRTHAASVSGTLAVP